MTFRHVLEGNHHGARSTRQPFQGCGNTRLLLAKQPPTPPMRAGSCSRDCIYNPQRIVVFGAPHVQTLEVVNGGDESCEAARAVKILHAVSVRAAL